MSVGIFQNDDYCNVCLYKTVLFEDKLLLQFLIQTILFIYLNKDSPYCSAFCSKIAQDFCSVSITFLFTSVPVNFKIKL